MASFNCAIHSVIEFPPNLLVEVTLAGFLLLMIAVTGSAIRRGPRDIANLAIAFFFAWGIEATATCRGDYAYYFAYFYLPGWVPLYVICGWAMVFYAAYEVSRRLFSDWKLIALLTALLSVSLDLMVDPGASGLNLWVWTNEIRPWYQVPWSNFFGWSLLMGSLAAAVTLMETYLQDKPQTLPWLAVEKALAFTLGYLVFAVIFAVYLVVTGLPGIASSDIGQTLLHVIIFGSMTLFVALQMPPPGGEKLDWISVTVPTYLVTCGFCYALHLSWFPQAGRPDYNTLVFIIPFAGALVLSVYYRPYSGHGPILKSRHVDA